MSMNIEKYAVQNTEVFRVTDVLDPISFLHLARGNILSDPNFKKTTYFHATFTSDATIFKPLFDQLAVVMKETVGKKLKPTGLTIRLNKDNGRWHTHPPQFSQDTENFYITIYYMHMRWVECGELYVSKSKDEKDLIFPPTPNSVIIHNNELGHGVMPYDAEVCDRIAMYAHWVPCDAD
jgi:hypothetical protein